MPENFIAMNELLVDSQSSPDENECKLNLTRNSYTYN